jgi:peptidoglycan-N-acetylglucosamine deacetylase
MKPLASISLDLDNLWSYMKTHGDAGWESFPSYLDVFIPHVLDALDRWNLKITFFIVGQDAALDKNREPLSLITKRGHEVGNHSFDHEPWLHLYPKERIQREIGETEDRIQNATGERPRGFRGPGFSWSPDLFEVLVERNYLFDASTLPTYLGPLARMYYFWTAKLTEEQKKDRSELFGTFKEGFRPVRAYQWSLASGRSLLEIPVTTIPFIKSPFHLSYLLYLSRFSGTLMSLYLQTALFMCRMTGTQPSFLLHPLDLIGGDQIPQLAFFPGMDLPSDKKIEVFDKVIGMLCQKYTIVNMTTHASALLQNANLQTLSVDKESAG